MSENENQLLQPSHLPYGMPDFSAIRTEDLLPALKTAIVAEEAVWDEVANSTEPATVANTVDRIEEASRPLSTFSSIAFTLFSSIGGEEYEAIEMEAVELLTEHSNKFSLNPALYQRYRQVDLTDADEETKYVVSQIIRDFELAGVALPEEQREQIRALDKELTNLETEFSQKVVKAMEAASVDFDSEEELAGADEKTINQLRAAAVKKYGPETGKYRLGMLNFSNQPLQAVLTNPQSRRKILESSLSRGFGADPATDTRDLVVKIARLRARRAAILGYPNHSEVVAKKGLAGGSQEIWDLLTSLSTPAFAKVEEESGRLRQMAAEDPYSDGELKAADWFYYETKLRREQLGVDDELLKPYLELRSVYEKGVFYAAECLYGLKFEPRPDIPAYAPEVEVWEVKEASGEGIGLFVADYYTRPGKHGGAWMNNLVDQSHLWGTKPVVVNNLNLTKPAEGEPTLLTWDEVETAFHEFGHGLHGLLSDVKYASVSGASVPRDFVELPSQLNEMWMFHPRVLANFARHYETGEPLPQEWADKLAASKTFGQAFATAEFVASALLDQVWHRMGEAELPADAGHVEPFEQAALIGAGASHDLVPPRYRSTYFSHTFGGGYDAGYYSYTWAEVMVASMEEWLRGPGAIDGDGGLNRQAGWKLRGELLSRGESRPPMDSYRNVTGADPDPAALLRRRGLA